MNRHFLEVGRVNPQTKFMVTKGIEGQHVGIVGLGRIGSRITELVKSFKAGQISYYSPHHHPDKENSLGVDYLELTPLLEQSDIVFLCVDGAAKGFFMTEQFDHMRNQIPCS